MLPTQLNPQNSIVPPSSLQSALQMDPNQHLQLQQQQQQQQQPLQTPQSTGKRRRKADGNGDEAPPSSEPRRLRRSHEACARCRSKKIKCDSKHPRCTACATAGTVCHQEDRHRQTLTPRGHTERIEHQLAQCEALLKHHYSNFTLDSLDEIIAREGIDVSSIAPPPPSANFQIEGSPIRPFRPDGGPSHPQQPPKGYPPMYPPPGHIIHPPYPHPMMPYGPAPPYHPQMPMQPHGSYHPHLHPAFQQPPGAFPPPHAQPPPPTALPTPVHGQPPPVQRGTTATKGTDPNGNDMSNTEALAKNFGVSAAIVNNIMDAAPHDKEDLAVGSSGLSSGRDRSIGETTIPRDASHWVALSVRRNSTSSGAPNTLSIYRPTSNASTVEVWLPKDRNMVKHIVDVYFTHLNPHRPVFSRKDFDRILNDLYDGKTVSHDPGYVCSIYLILALGTLSDLNQRAVKEDIDSKAEVMQHLGPAIAKKIMPHDWPQHDEFFERALAVKPDLRVTISSLQALILLHWYLYTERQGRTLWRLVGSLVRLSIELGLHHDPTTQMNPSTDQHLFTEEECQLRITLWGIVLVHDRGTSILLGRPLAISPSDSNTPRPARPKQARLSDFSEHFELSQPVAEIQADIINALYTPKKQAADTIMRNATRIIKSMLEFRRGLPERYKYYFNGTSDWVLEKKSELVQNITEDEGLTLLKVGIARILLLRALFSSKELSYAHRHKALVDAIITSHNMIIIHNQLIRFPNIAFFTSPIPLHIAAMVILYGHMSKVDCLPPNIALEDLWLALDMLPRFRWRWERKDVNGGHPLIAKLAERVMDINLRNIVPTGHPVLLCEPEWDEDTVMSQAQKSQQSTPPLSAYPASAGGSMVYGPQPRAMNNAPGTMNGSHSGGSTPPNKQLVEVPSVLFYPFFPEAPIPSSGNGAVTPNGNRRHDYTQILAAAAAAGSQPSHDSYMSEERDTSHSLHPQQQMWMNVGQRAAMPGYNAPP